MADIRRALHIVRDDLPRSQEGAVLREEGVCHGIVDLGCFHLALVMSRGRGRDGM